MAHRTALITAGSIAAIVFAGAIAVGANLGILTVADSSPVGKLSASAPVQPSRSGVVQVYTGVTSSQKYIIRKAGSVEVAVTKGGLRLLDVNVRPHWKWTLAQTADRKLMVTFHFRSITYKFMAVLRRHGTIAARVDRPITRIVASAAPTTPVSWSAAPAVAPATSTSGSAPAPRSVSTAPVHGEQSDNSGGGQDD
jgi:hypothetical protein